MTITASLITDEHVRAYRDEGFFILERVIPDEHLELLRGNCQLAIDRLHREMDAVGTDTIGINHRGSRYFTAHPSLEQPVLFRFIYSQLMAEVCRALVGPEVNVFWEQYVVKMAEAGMHFGWHQDSAYVGVPHAPYLSCWCPLDDVDEANGTIYVLPFARAGGRTLKPHTHEAGTNDLIGYDGDDPGVAVIAPAGSVVVFSSLTLHRSGTNRTTRPRRTYLIQYGDRQPVRFADGTPKGRSEAFLRDGRIVGVATA